VLRRRHGGREEGDAEVSRAGALRAPRREYSGVRDRGARAAASRRRSVLLRRRPRFQLRPEGVLRARIGAARPLADAGLPAPERRLSVLSGKNEEGEGMRIAHGIALLLLAAGLAACGGSRLNQENFDKIRDGMSPKEVRDILGDPVDSAGGSFLG